MPVTTTCLLRTHLFQPFCPVWLVATYHTSNVLLLEKSPAFKRTRVSAKSKLKLKPAVLSEKSTQSQEAWKTTPKQVNKRAVLSSELKKLVLEDERIASKRDWTDEQKTSQTAAKHYEYVFGISPCLLAITSGKRNIYGLYVKEGETTLRASLLKICEEACRHGVPIYHVSKRDLEKMAPGHVHQGVCLQASPLSYVTEEKQSWPLFRKDKDIPPLWLVIESIQDPMNLGAVLRSAYFLGVDGVVSSISHSCPLSPVVSKASSGTMEVMEIYGCKNIEELLKMKKAIGWDVVGTVGSGSEESYVTKCSDFTVTKPTLLLIGGEGGGLSQKLQNHCQTLLTIPAGRQLFMGIESLNVSVATGILLYSLLYSRRSNKPE